MHSKRSRLGSVGKSDQRQNKGLRHFSWKVCEKVRQKQSTTYNEVADELVKELSETGEFEKNKDAVSFLNCHLTVFDIESLSSLSWLTTRTLDAECMMH